MAKRAQNSDSSTGDESSGGGDEGEEASVSNYDEANSGTEWEEQTTAGGGAFTVRFGVVQFAGSLLILVFF